MSFLASNNILSLLEQGVLQNEISDFITDQSLIKSNSIQMSIGAEAFTTTDPLCNERKLIDLKTKKMFYIESGQFALLITEEIVSVPINMMGFISLITDYKYKGLINVSGFHVNPGWKGRLIFTVYNAGPHQIPIKYNEKAFRIWFATIDSTKLAFAIEKEQKPEQLSIDSNKIYNIDGDVYSPHVLGKKMKLYEEGWRQKWIILGGGLLAGLLIGISVQFATSLIKYFSADSRLLLKEEFIAEIKDQIVKEALKELQENSVVPPKQESGSTVSSKKNNSKKKP